MTPTSTAFHRGIIHLITEQYSRSDREAPPELCALLNAVLPTDAQLSSPTLQFLSVELKEACLPVPARTARCRMNGYMYDRSDMQRLEWSHFRRLRREYLERFIESSGRWDIEDLGFESALDKLVVWLKTRKAE